MISLLACSLVSLPRSLLKKRLTLDLVRLFSPDSGSGRAASAPEEGLDDPVYDLDPRMVRSPSGIGRASAGCATAREDSLLIIIGGILLAAPSTLQVQDFRTDRGIALRGLMVSRMGESRSDRLIAGKYSRILESIIADRVWARAGFGENTKAGYRISIT